MVFKIHSRCNLNCKYCYMYNKGDLSYQNKPKRVPSWVIKKIPEMFESEYERTGKNTFTLAFHGGEPLLVGKEFFVAMMEYFKLTLSSFDMHYSLQTNAVLIDDEWLDILSRFGVVVAASIDGPPNINSVNRVFHSGQDSTEQAIDGILKLKDSNVDFAGVLCVVQPFVSGREVVKFLTRDLELDWFDLLLPDFTHDTLPDSWSIQQESILAYMIDAFEEWSMYSKRQVHCRFFESIIGQLMGKPSKVETIGVGGLYSMVIETDGTLEPHDVFRICKDFDRTTNITVGRDAIAKLHNSMQYQLSLPDNYEFSGECQACDQFSTCKSGHFMHRFSKENGFSNPSVHCHVLYGLINHIMQFLGLLLNEVYVAPRKQVLPHLSY